MSRWTERGQHTLFHYDHHSRCREGHPALVLETTIYNPTAERSLDLVILCDDEADRDRLAEHLEHNGWGTWQKVNSKHLSTIFRQQWVANSRQARRAATGGEVALQDILTALHDEMERRPRTPSGPRVKLFGVL